MIIQTNIFICERCNAMESYTDEVDFYSDPVVGIPMGKKDWGYKDVRDKELLLCPECIISIKSKNGVR